LNEFKNDRAKDVGRFDAVLVDEAQLLPRDWLKCATLALNQQDPETANLLVVGDGTQRLFRGRRFTWADAGIKATGGRTTILKRNYRNTREIVDIANIFARESDYPETQGPSDRAPPPECVRNGSKPELIPLESRLSECDCVTALVRTWLLAGIAIQGRRERIQPSDIAVLYPNLPSRSSTLLKQLNEKLNAVAPVVSLDGPSGSLCDEGVRIISIQRATGLQFRIVVLIWTDILPMNFADRDDRTLLYLGMTRAEDVLVILHSGASKLVDEIQRALSGQNATSA
jgi:superfamily I DNA/RNA helicase